MINRGVVRGDRDEIGGREMTSMTSMGLADVKFLVISGLATYTQLLSSNEQRKRRAYQSEPST